MESALVTLSIAPQGDSLHTAAMLSSGDLIERLREKRIPNAAIARTLGLDPSSVTHMLRGKRRILLDEAKKLCDAFELENAPPKTVISRPVASLLVRHAARLLGVELAPDDPRSDEIASDLRAFSEFASDPQARDSVEQVQAFLRTIEIMRSRKESSI